MPEADAEEEEEVSFDEEEAASAASDLMAASKALGSAPLMRLVSRPFLKIMNVGMLMTLSDGYPPSSLCKTYAVMLYVCAICRWLSVLTFVKVIWFGLDSCWESCS